MAQYNLGNQVKETALFYKNENYSGQDGTWDLVRLGNKCNGIGGKL